jgi:transposase
MTCPNCGEEMERGELGTWFCPDCGYSENREEV